MNPLAKALGRDTHEYQVGVPWAGLNDLIQPLRGNLIIGLGAPGVGKSAFSLSWALSNDDPSLLISLDTDLSTQALRSAAIVHDVTIDQVKADPSRYARLLEVHPRIRKVRAYDIGVTSRDVFDMVKAEEEFWGMPPSLTIVDNIANLIRDGGYEDYRRLFVELHRVARMADTCILALHHVGRQDAKATGQGQGLTLWSGHYSGEQEAEMVLGLYSKGDQDLTVQVLKNRSGRADPTGHLSTSLIFEKSKMLVRDLNMNERSVIQVRQYREEQAARLKA